MRRMSVGTVLLVAVAALTLSSCGSASDDNAAVKDALRQELSVGITTAPDEVRNAICSNQEGAVQGSVTAAQLDDRYRVLSADDVTQIAREVFADGCQ
jgi:hypothetical protein